MGCVGSKKEQEPHSKGTGNDDLQNRAQTAHYVKDPTTGNSGNKAVSSQFMSQHKVFHIVSLQLASIASTGYMLGSTRWHT